MYEYKIATDGVQASYPAAAHADKKRICLIVVGMHRSGTSSVARVLSLLGAQLPKNILGVAPGNERGHWEPQPLIAFNEATLEKLGSRWDDWRALSLDGLLVQEQEEIERDVACLIDEQYGHAMLFVLKEPRICRLVPIYQKALARLGIEPRYVLTFRNPLDVIASLGARDGMTAGFAALLWLRHVLDAERVTRGLPRAFLAYETTLTAWREAFSCLGERLGIVWPRPLNAAALDIEAFLTPELRHHKYSRADVEQNEGLTGWVKQTYAALLALDRGADQEAFATLDRVCTEFEPMAQIFGEAVFPELAAREVKLSEHNDPRVRRLTLALGASDRRVEDLTLALAGGDRRVIDLTQSLADSDQRVNDLSEALAAGKARIEDLTNALASGDRRVEDLMLALAGGDRRVTDLTQALAGSDQRVRDLSEALVGGKARIEDLTNALASSDRRVEDLTLALFGSDRRVIDLTKSLADSDQRVRDLSEALAAGKARIEDLTNALASSDRRVEDLTLALAGGDRRVTDLTQALASSDRRIEDLTLALTGGDRRVMDLTQALASSDRRVEDLTQALQASDQRLCDLTEALDASGRRAEDQAQAREAHNTAT